MMRKITLICLLFIVCLGWEGHAQVSEGFESGIPSTWNTFKTNPSVTGFQISSYANSGAQSVYNNDESGQSTNYLVTEGYIVSDGVNDLLGFWYGQNYTPNYYGYSGVWISTVSADPITNPSDFTELQEFNAAFGFSEDIWSEYTLDLSAYEGQTVYIAFKYSGDYAHEFNIDDFSLSAVPTCFPPADLTVGNVAATTIDLTWTDPNGTNSWDVSVVPAGDPAPTATSTPDYPGVTSNPFQIPTVTLTANTAYEFYVRADCGSGDISAWSNSGYFLTAPVPGSINVYGINNSSTEFFRFDITDPSTITKIASSSVLGFEDAGAIDPSNPGTAYVLDDLNGFYSVDIATGIYTSLGTIPAAGNEAWSGMEFDPTTGILYAISSDYAATSTSTLYSIDINGVSATSIGAMGISIAVSLAIDGSGYMYVQSITDDKLYFINKTSGVGTVVGPLGFDSDHGQGMFWDYNTNTMYMTAINADNGDQLEWRSVNTASGETTYIADLSGQIAWVSSPGAAVTPPSCLPPTFFTVSNITSNGADLGWNGTASNWEAIVVPSGDPAPTATTSGIATSTNSYSVSGLNQNASHDLYVRANCGAGDMSDWAGPYTFTTACGVVSTFPWTEDFESVAIPDLPNCWEKIDNNADGDEWETYANYGVNNSTTVGLHTDFNSGANDDYLILPKFALTGNQQLVYNVRVRSDSEPDEYEVVLSTTGTAPADFANVLLASTVISSETSMKMTLDLSTYTGQVYIAIHLPNSSTDGWYIYFDEFTVRDIPTCIPPTNLGIIGYSATIFNVEWTAEPNASNGYEWFVFESGVDPLVGTPVDSGVNLSTDLNASPSGLQPGTKYDFYVKSNCGATDGMSDLEGPLTVTTLLTNDDLSGAIPLTLNGGCTGDAYSNVGATVETSEPSGNCWGGGDGVQTSVWFSFVAPSSGNVRISTDILPAEIEDSQIVVYAAPTTPGDVSTLTSVGCNDDAGDIGFMSIVDLTGLTPGDTYYIQVDGFNGDEGTFCITADDLSTGTVVISNPMIYQRVQK